MLLVRRYSCNLAALTACFVVAVFVAVFVAVVIVFAVVALVAVVAVVALVAVVEVVIDAVVAVVGTLEDRMLFGFSADQELAEQQAEISL